MAIKVVPEWMVHLEDEDVTFIKKFILSSGSEGNARRIWGNLSNCPLAIR